MYTNNLVFLPGSADKRGDKTIFEYVVAEDYSDTLIALEAITQDTKEKLTVTRVDGPLRESSLQQSGYNSIDFMWFQIDITPVIKGGASEVLLEINEHHKRRKIAHPARLSIINEQTVRYEDSRYLLSPYRVMEQESVYIFPKDDILDYTKQPEANWDRRGIKYGPLRNMQPFSFDLISLHLKMPNPQLILGEARKTIHVSHWGFISVDEYFALENVGAKLKGEFSRVDFTKRDNAKNCMRQISAKFPWYI